MKIKKKTNKKLKYPFRAEYCFDIYDMTKAGLPMSRIADKLGIPFQVFRDWKKRNIIVQYALNMGKLKCEKKASEVQHMDELVLGRLPPRLQETWQQLIDARKAKVTDCHELSMKTQEERQLLFIHAMIRFGFSKRKALLFTGIPNDTVGRWESTEAFHKLLSMVNEAKKDFFEEALIDQVQRLDGPSIIFANKTLNADRGYSEKKSVSVSGSIEHKHAIQTQISLDELDLPIDVRMAIAEAMEKRRKFLEMEDSPQKVIEMKKTTSGAYVPEDDPEDSNEEGD